MFEAGVLQSLTVSTRTFSLSSSLYFPLLPLPTLCPLSSHSFPALSLHLSFHFICIQGPMTYSTCSWNKYRWRRATCDLPFCILSYSFELWITPQGHTSSHVSAQTYNLVKIINLQACAQTFLSFCSSLFGNYNLSSIQIRGGRYTVPSKYRRVLPVLK